MRRIDPIFRTLTLLLVLPSSVLCTPTYLGQDSSMDGLNLVRGTWVLKSIYNSPNVQGPNPSQQKKLLGTSIILNDGVLKVCGKSVPVKSIKVSQVSSDDFLANTHARFNEVGINASSVKEVIINERKSGTCFGAFPLPGQDIYAKNTDEVLIYFEGVFYRAVRKK